MPSRRRGPPLTHIDCRGSVWTFTIYSELLSIFSAVYAFINSGRPLLVMPLWPDVLEELRVMLALATLGTCSLAQPWSTCALMVDTSLSGYGAVACDTPLDEIGAEARFAERKGWTTEMERSYSETEYICILDPDAPESVCASPYDLADVVCVARPLRVFLHIFVGRRRAEDLQH